MNLQTGLDVSCWGTSQIAQMNDINNGGMVPAYFELSTGISGCPILQNGEIYDDGSGRLQALQAIISNDNPNLSVGYYHFLYDPKYVPEAMPCYDQGVTFGEALTNNAIPSTYLLLALDIEGKSFGSNQVSLSEIENCVSEFMSGLTDTITGNFQVMIYSSVNMINDLSLPPMYESSQLTAAKLWLADAIYGVNFGYEPTNSQINTAIDQMNSITWGGVTGWSGWQYGITQPEINNLNIDLDLFNMDVIYDSSMYYNPLN